MKLRGDLGRLGIIPMLLLAQVAATHRLQAETFSSSTNFIRTLSVATNEAIFITTLKYDSGRGKNEARRGLSTTLSLGAQTAIIPLIEWHENWPENQKTKLLAGPMEIQFKTNNVVMEFQRVRSTNVFTAIFTDSNPANITVPVGRTVALLFPTSWGYNLDGVTTTPFAAITISNSTTQLTDVLKGGENFSGPLSITITPSDEYGSSSMFYTNGWLTFYFTDEFSSIPNIGATVVSAGNSILTIQKSQDLVHWDSIFFKPIMQESKAFYRFNFSK